MRGLVNGQLGHIGTVKPMLLKSGHQVVELDSNLYVHLCHWQQHCQRAAYIRKDTRNEGPPPHLVRAIF